MANVTHRERNQSLHEQKTGLTSEGKRASLVIIPIKLEPLSVLAKQ